ncbi:hypothetical protein CONLIGDRAFT_155170 [Coniochaeta ligniaria NRRL 30616]|uniref:F-box domain-containing protein n=1 Tax=Coniochaeta ligniaria NRRL 30616 TaxID=1408157 RepID=A0A1J7J049_9PEZI|nr:hypothetical protein CONLIGDRAFT_155170 [Coniochaeta ligniaria NRRL 30616]
MCPRNEAKAIINNRTALSRMPVAGKMGAHSSSSAGTGLSVSRLTNLPQELLDQILECLVPDQPELGDTRPVSFEKMIVGEAWYDITLSRRALLSLCLTSRDMYKLAQPLLYRVISLLDEESIVLLCRTYSETPALGKHARYLSCHLTLTRSNVISEIKKSLGRLVRTFQPDHLILSRHYPATFSAVNILYTALSVISAAGDSVDDVPQIILFLVASFMTKLETILLQVPICDDHADYISLSERFADSHLNLMGLGSESGPVPPISTEMLNAIERPFQHVKTLLLQGDPELLTHFEGDNCNCELPELWGVQTNRYWPVFDALPSLSTIEVSADDGVFTNRRHARPDGTRPPYLERIRHLYLHDSVATPRDLHHVLVNAPNLTTLYMTPRRDPELWPDEEGEGMDEHPESLDAALRRRPRQLRHLDIAWYDCQGNEPFIGPGGRLASLPRLTCLEKLCVQLAVLYGVDPVNLLTPLVALLPPNIAELTLEEWWWENITVYDGLYEWTSAQKVAHYQGKSEYRAQALAILSRFAEDCGGGGGGSMPNLRRVTFQTKFLWTWQLEGYVSTESHFGRVRELFAGRGVVFEVDEDRSGTLPDVVD